MSEKLKKFKCEITKEIFSSENFKIYGAIPYGEDVVSQNLVLNDFGNVTLVGNMPRLNVYSEYDIIAKEKQDKKFGYQYEIKKINRDLPTTKDGVKKFLSEILTLEQSEEVMREYPNIIDLVLKGREKEIDTSKLHNIGAYRINVIVEKIQENYVFIDLINEFSEYGVTMATIKKMSDKYGDSDTIKKEFYEHPYEILCGLDRVGFKKADKIILQKLPKMKNSYNRMFGCVNYILDENENGGNTIIKIKTLKSECNNLASDSIKHFDEVIENERYNIINNIIMYKETYETEVSIAKQLIEMNSEKNQIKWEYDLSNINEGEEYPLTGEQIDAIQNVLDNNVSLLIGFGGSGKTYTMEKLINTLKKMNKSFLLLAPTGRASQILSEYTNEEAYTIHRGLGYNPSNDPVWHYNKGNLLLYDMVVIDESSMIDIDLMVAVLGSIDANKTKILFVGDSEQISSVGKGNVLFDILRSNIFKISKLTKIFRYAEGGLYKVSSDVRVGKNYIPENKKDNKSMVFGENKDYTLIKSTQEDNLKNILKVYHTLLVKSSYVNDNIIILSSMNKGQYGTIEINKFIQKYLLNKTDILDKNRYIKYGDKLFYVGDRVIKTKNSYNMMTTTDGGMTDVFNGNLGVIKDIRKSEIHILFGDKLVVFNKSDLNSILLGYAISCHKSQGGGFDYVILSTPKAHTYMMNKNLFYTALTRTKKKCYHITELKIINSSLKKSELKSRNTLLRILLLKVYNKLNEKKENEDE